MTSTRIGTARLFLFYLLLPCVESDVCVFAANDTVFTTDNATITYYCIKIPTLLEHSRTSTLIALGEGRVGSCSDVTRTDLLIRRSHDGGETWTPLRILLTNSSDATTNVVGNAAPVEDKSTGRIWLLYNRNNKETWITSSDDGGETWASPIMHPEVQHSEWKWVGVGPPAGLQLQSGRLLVPGYHSEIWPNPNRSSIGSGLTKGHVVISDDHGTSWRLAADDFGYEENNPDNNRFYVNEQQAAQLPDGRVIMNSRTLAARRAISFSDDEGESFMTTVYASGLYETWQGCEGSMIYHNSSGNLYYSGVQGEQPLRLYRSDLALFKSTNGGLNWEREVTISPGASGYSALISTYEDGGLSVLYEHSNCHGKGPGGCPLVFLPEIISFKRLL